MVGEHTPNYSDRPRRRMRTTVQTIATSISARPINTTPPSDPNPLTKPVMMMGTRIVDDVGQEDCDDEAYAEDAEHAGRRSREPSVIVSHRSKRY